MLPAGTRRAFGPIDDRDLETLEKVKERPFIEGIYVPHGGHLRPLLGRRFVYHVEQLYDFSRTSTKLLEVCIDTLMITIVNDEGRAKLYPILCASTLETEEENIVTINFVLENII